MTGVRSRYVTAVAGLFLITLSLLPKAAFLVASIPPAVLGGAGLAMFGMVAATGIKILHEADITDRRNQLLVAVSMGMGMAPVVRARVLRPPAPLDGAHHPQRHRHGHRQRAGAQHPVQHPGREGAQPTLRRPLSLAPPGCTDPVRTGLPARLQGGLLWASASKRDGKARNRRVGRGTKPDVAGLDSAPLASLRSAPTYGFVQGLRALQGIRGSAWRVDGSQPKRTIFCTQF